MKYGKTLQSIEETKHFITGKLTKDYTRNVHYALNARPDVGG